VCTANINRSPMGEAWAKELFQARFVMAEVRSAGTHAWDGALAGADTTEAMLELGMDLREHRSTRLSPELLAWADVVAVMEPMHADIALQLDPSVEPKLRRLWHHLPDGADHVEDPIGKQLDAHREAAARVGDATKAAVEEWFAARRAARP
jgi:protein-tyrosine-phosphatase